MSSTIAKKILVIGGTRSGKSAHALTLAQKSGKPQKIFIATAIPFDDEMRQRIQNHQSERGKDWLTVEAPYELPQTIERQGSRDTILLVDCITLWLNNLLIKSASGDAVPLADKLDQLIQSLHQSPATVYVVSNEVGTGVVPENRLARTFRDLAGMANQDLAACVDQVIWMVAGIPVTIKG